MTEAETKKRKTIWDKRNRWIVGVISAIIFMSVLILILPEYLESYSAPYMPVLKFLMVIILITFIILLCIIAYYLVKGEFALEGRIKEENRRKRQQVGKKVDISEAFRDWEPAGNFTPLAQRKGFRKAVGSSYGKAWEPKTRRKERSQKLEEARVDAKLVMRVREETEEYLIQKDIREKIEVIKEKVSKRKTFDQMLTNVVNSIGMRFVPVRRGEFLMGENKKAVSRPEHKVNITEPFHISIYPVTQEQWEKVMDDNPSHSKDGLAPVTNVSYKDCVEFTRRLNKLERTLKYRLPSEAQWENACRAGSTSRYSFGDDLSRIRSYAWTHEDGKDGSIHPVGLKEPNMWGIFDMHGNVWEWCMDRWHDNYEGAPGDDNPWMSGESGKYVRRGGSYKSKYCASAHRKGSEPDHCSKSLGFRVVMVFDPLAILAQGMFSLK